MSHSEDTSYPQRIMIVGCCGAGKSTLALKLREITSHPIIILDEHYYSENWSAPSKEEWHKIVIDLADRPKYIMDGNYGSSMHLRLPKADLIIFLDHPTFKLVRRVLWRTFKNWGKTRPGMPEGCPERFDRDFLNYVITFNKKRKPLLLDRVNTYAADTPFIILQSADAITDFATKLSSYKTPSTIHHG